MNSVHRLPSVSHQRSLFHYIDFLAITHHSGLHFPSFIAHSCNQSHACLKAITHTIVHPLSFLSLSLVYPVYCLTYSCLDLCQCILDCPIILPFGLCLPLHGIIKSFACGSARLSSHSPCYTTQTQNRTLNHTPYSKFHLVLLLAGWLVIQHPPWLGRGNSDQVQFWEIHRTPHYPSSYPWKLLDKFSLVYLFSTCLLQVQNYARREWSHSRLVQSSTPAPLNSWDMQTKTKKHNKKQTTNDTKQFNNI